MKKGTKKTKTRKATAVSSKKRPGVNRPALAKQRKHREKSFKMALFLAKFFAIYLILSTLVEVLDLSFFTMWLALVSGSALGMVVSGNVILINGQQFMVTNACTGLVSASILAAVIFALKKPNVEKKVTIFLVGLIVLLVTNIPRLMLVLVTAKLGLDAGAVHVFTWFVMSALILVLWYYGTKLYAKIEDFSELL